MLPWDTLSGETVRAVIKDLGLSQYTRCVRRTELVKILQEIEADGSMFCLLFFFWNLCDTDALCARS